jgi:hypothetical protein
MAIATVASAVPFQREDTGGALVYDQVLDNPQEPLYGIELVNIFESTIEGFGDTTINEFAGHWEFAYYRIPDMGHVAVGVAAQLTLFQDSAGVSLPDELLKLALDGTLTWRTDFGVAYEFGFQPGLYTDFEDFDLEGLAFPFSISVIRSFMPELSGVAGLEIRPQFETVVRPRLGITWAAGDTVWMQIMIPESRAVWAVDDLWRAHVSAEWNSVDYRIGDKQSLNRDSIAVEDIRLAIGVTYQMSDLHHFTVELGQSIDRTFDFDNATPGLPSDFDIDDTAFLRFMLGGPF